MPSRKIRRRIPELTVKIIFTDALASSFVRDRGVATRPVSCGRGRTAGVPASTRNADRTPSEGAREKSGREKKRRIARRTRLLAFTLEAAPRHGAVGRRPALTRPSGLRRTGRPASRGARPSTLQALPSPRRQAGRGPASRPAFAAKGDISRNAPCPAPPARSKADK